MRNREAYTDLNNQLFSQEYDKRQQYCQEQRGLLRDLENLKERASDCDLDDRKDQLMTVLELALPNLAVSLGDNYFPPEYARAIWQRLAPFFRLPGCIAEGGETSAVELRGFNDQ